MLRHDAVDAGRAEAERACHAIAATRRGETERRETQGWRDAPDGAELFAEGSDARNELKRLEAWLQTTEFRVKVDDERSRRGVRDCAFDRGGGAAMAPRGARPPPSRHRAGVASMAWRLRLSHGGDVPRVRERPQKHTGGASRRVPRRPRRHC